MSSTIIVRLSLHQVGNQRPNGVATGFIEPSDKIWGLKDNVTKLLVTDQFNVSKLQPFPLENLDVERMTFQVAWDCSSGSVVLPNSDVGNGDVKELMEAMRNRGWKDVLDVKVVFDPAVKSGLKTMDEGERAWAPITARVDEEHRLAKIEFAKLRSEDESD